MTWELAGQQELVAWTCPLMCVDLFAGSQLFYVGGKLASWLVCLSLDCVAGQDT